MKKIEKHPSKKLPLHAETVRRLERADLGRAVGGAADTSIVAGTGNPTSSVG